MNWKDDREISDRICKVVDSIVEVSRTTCTMCDGDKRESIYAVTESPEGRVSVRAPGEGPCPACDGSGEFAPTWYSWGVHAPVLGYCMAEALRCMDGHDYQRATMWLLAARSWVFDATAADLEASSQEEKDEKAEYLRRLIEHGRKDDE